MLWRIAAGVALFFLFRCTWLLHLLRRHRRDVTSPPDPPLAVARRRLTRIRSPKASTPQRHRPRSAFPLLLPDLPKRIPSGRIPTMIVLGSGGHTAEMLALVNADSQLDRTRYAPLIYVTAATDTTSEERARKLEATFAPQRARGRPRFVTTPRSREVGQSWITTIVTTAYALLHAFYLVYTQAPRLVLVNGPGTCVPLCWAAFALQVMCPWRPACRIIFIESFCRVTSLSLSGRLLLPLCSRFVVQWPELAERVPGSEYLGILC